MNSRSLFTLVVITIVIKIILLSSCSGISENNENQNPSFNEKIKLQQYEIQGAQLYSTHCANCHQGDGTGLGRLIPPLKGNKHFIKNLNQTICIIRHGMEGSILIDGVEYNGKMPANYGLTDLEIAELSTFICNSWDNEYGLISISEVQGSLKNCR